MNNNITVHTFYLDYTTSLTKYIPSTIGNAATDRQSERTKGKIDNEKNVIFFTLWVN